MTLFFDDSSSKRRRNEELLKAKKSNEDKIEITGTKTDETVKTNGDASQSSSTGSSVKRVPISLEEMVERNKKAQEAIAKVNV